MYRPSFRPPSQRPTPANGGRADHRDEARPRRGRAEKTRFYEQQRKLLAAEGNAAAGDDLDEEARQTLDRAHAELDADLSAFDTRFPAKDAPHFTPDGADPAR